MPDVMHIFAISHHRCMYSTVQFQTQTQTGRHLCHGKPKRYVCITQPTLISNIVFGDNGIGNTVQLVPACNTPEVEMHCVRGTNWRCSRATQHSQSVQIIVLIGSGNNIKWRTLTGICPRWYDKQVLSKLPSEPEYCRLLTHRTVHYSYL